MKNKGVFIISVAMLLLFLGFSLCSPVSARPPQFEVIIKVTTQGFLDEKGNALTHFLQVPKGSDVKLIFEYVGAPGNEHELALMFSSGEKIYSDPISYKNKRSTISFSADKAGEVFDIFCIIDCNGMDTLTDLVIVTK